MGSSWRCIFLHAGYGLPGLTGPGLYHDKAPMDLLVEVDQQGFNGIVKGFEMKIFYHADDLIMLSEDAEGTATMGLL